MSLPAPLEVELKLALEAPERLDALLEALPAPRTVVEQRNVYLVPAAGPPEGEPVMVRVREVWQVREAARSREALLLTAKRRRSVDNGVFVAEEHEQPLDAERWEAFEAGAELAGATGPVFDWLAANGLRGPWRIEGEMRNERREIPVEGYRLEVDRTTFPDGTVDAEVEVETADPEGARVLLARLAAGAGVALRPQTLTKYARFLAHGGR